MSSSQNGAPGTSDASDASGPEASAPGRRVWPWVAGVVALVVVGGVGGGFAYGANAQRNTNAAYLDAAGQVAQVAGVLAANSAGLVELDAALGGQDSPGVSDVVPGAEALLGEVAAIPGFEVESVPAGALRGFIDALSADDERLAGGAQSGAQGEGGTQSGAPLDEGAGQSGATVPTGVDAPFEVMVAQLPPLAGRLPGAHPGSEIVPQSGGELTAQSGVQSGGEAGVLVSFRGSGKYSSEEVEELRDLHSRLLTQDARVLATGRNLITVAFDALVQDTQDRWDGAKSTLEAKIIEARNLLAASNGKVADNKTREGLQAAINTANESISEAATLPSEVEANLVAVEEATGGLDAAMKSVRDSQAKRTKADQQANNAQSNTAEDSDYAGGGAWEDDGYTNWDNYTDYNDYSDYGNSGSSNGGGNSGGTAGTSGNSGGSGSSGGGNVDWGNWCFDWTVGEDPVRVPC